MAGPRSTKDILRAARDMLRTAELGLADIASDDPQRRLPGLRNLVVFARAVTNVLQNLRSTEADFDAWYAAYVAEMRADPLLRYFYELRSEILKEGTVKTTTSVYIESFDFGRDRNLFGTPPPNATEMFIGDRVGGAGWSVRLPDGTEEPYYVNLPKRVMDARLHLPDAPLEHRGQQLSDNTLLTLGTAYLKYLENMIDGARQRFLACTGSD
jgi:hypothetical protein